MDQQEEKILEKARWDELIKLRSLFNYQFGENYGDLFFPEDIKITRSKRTGRIRDIFYNGELIAIFRPRVGLITLSLVGAKRFLDVVEGSRSIVVVDDGVEDFIRKGKSVFAKHVIKADHRIRSQDEVIITNEKKDLLAVGKAFLSGREMLCFNRGIAVNVRKGLKH